MIAPELEQVLAFLIPIFLAAAHGDHASARAAALKLVESYGATNGEELLLAAEVVALSFATLDSLGKSVGDPALSISTRLRLRSNANALSRAAHRNRDALAQARRRGTQPVIPAPRAAPVPPQASLPQAPALLPEPLAALPEAVRKVRDAIVQAAPSLAQTLTQGDRPMSRQQRRFLTRKAEQARAAQERDARHAARLAERAAMLARDKTTTGPHCPDTASPAGLTTCNQEYQPDPAGLIRPDLTPPRSDPVVVWRP